MDKKIARYYLDLARKFSQADEKSHDVLQGYFSHSATQLNPELRKNPVDQCPRCKVDRTESNQIKEEVPKVQKGAVRRDKVIKRLRKVKKPNSRQTSLLQKLLQRKNGYTKLTCITCGYWTKKPPERFKVSQGLNDTVDSEQNLKPKTVKGPVPTAETPQKSLPPILHSLFSFKKESVKPVTKPSKTSNKKNLNKNTKASKPKLKPKTPTALPSKGSSNSLLDFYRTIQK